MSDNVLTPPVTQTGGATIRTIAKTVNTTSGVVPQTQVMVIDVGGNADGSSETPWTGNVGLIGASGTPNQLSVTVGTSSGQMLAAAAATTFIRVIVPVSATNGIWVRWDGNPATLSAPAEYIAPGETVVWIKSQGFLPTSQINAIASASTAIVLMYF
jgi:hypothetical protein